MALPREAAEPPASTWRNQVDVQLHSQNPGPQVLEEAAQGGCVLLASVLKELTPRAASVPLHQGHKVCPKE